MRKWKIQTKHRILNGKTDNRKTLVKIRYRKFRPEIARTNERTNEPHSHLKRTNHHKNVLMNPKHSLTLNFTPKLPPTPWVNITPSRSPDIPPDCFTHYKIMSTIRCTLALPCVEGKGGWDTTKLRISDGFPHLRHEYCTSLNLVLFPRSQQS